MQPSSTSRWPWAGSRPVVSVSRTISRILVYRCRRPREGGDPVIAALIVLTGCPPRGHDRYDSAPPFRHCSDTRQNITHLRARILETFRCIHHEIGAPALFGVRYLLGKNGGEFLFAHAGALEGA